MTYHEASLLQTPCYILNKDRLDRNIELMKQSFEKHWNNLIIGYSFKTNSLPWLLYYLMEKNIFAEVVSPFEYKLAKNLGYSENNIILNGPYKNQNHIVSILDGGGILNIDTQKEVDFICNIKDKKNWKVGLRVNFDLEKACPSETLMGDEPGRFGLNLENGDLASAIYQLQSAGIKISGLHMHNNTKTKSLRVFRTLTQKACHIAKKFELQLEYIDIGGGFFGDKPESPTYEMYASTIAEILKKYFKPEHTALIIEPGTAMIASSFSYLCKAFDIKKHKNKNLIFTDGSFVHTDFQMNQRKYSYELLSTKETNKSRYDQVVTGFTCMEKDLFLEISSGEYEVNINDYLLLQNIGAYTLNFTPLFIEMPPAVYVNSKGAFHLVREKWDCQEYLIKNYYKMSIT